MSRSVRSSGELMLLVGQLVRECEKLGVGAHELLSDAELDPTCLSDLDSTVSVSTIVRLWEGAMRRTRCTRLPVLVGQHTRLSDLRLYGFLIMSSEQAQKAIARAIRFAGLISTSGHWELVTDDSQARVVWVRPGKPTLGIRVANEVAVVTFLSSYREATSSSVPIAEATFRHDAPSDADAYEAQLGCPVRWGAATDSFAFPLKGLDVVPKDANPALAAFLVEQAERQLPQAPDASSFLNRVVRAIVIDLADGSPMLKDCSRRLGMSTRTLNRRLADAGTSYSKLVDDVRRDRAVIMLDSVSATETAFALGYSDASSFSRAFRRWTGQSPLEYRRARVSR